MSEQDIEQKDFVDENDKDFLDNYRSFCEKNFGKNIIKIGTKYYAILKTQKYNEKTGEIENIEEEEKEKKISATKRAIKLENQASIYELCSQADQFNSSRRTIIVLMKKLSEVIEKINSNLPKTEKKIENDLLSHCCYKQLLDIDEIVNDRVPKCKKTIKEAEEATLEELNNINFVEKYKEKFKKNNNE